MRIFVGTSGWSYDWNDGGSLDWYRERSGLNAIELNASFYRIPRRDQVTAWALRAGPLDWSVKVSRSVTHRHFLNAVGLVTYGRFLEAFLPLDSRISYYLFQFSPRFSIRHLDRIRELLDRFPSGKIAFEFRHPSWFTFDFSRLSFDGAVVSPDSPDHQGLLYSKNGRIYLRFHGRRLWYSDQYHSEELREIADRVRQAAPRRVHAFFNNDHFMLQNARDFLSMLAEGEVQ